MLTLDNKMVKMEEVIELLKKPGTRVNLSRAEIHTTQGDLAKLLDALHWLRKANHNLTVEEITNEATNGLGQVRIEHLAICGPCQEASRGRKVGEVPGQAR